MHYPLFRNAFHQSQEGAKRINEDKMPSSKRQDKKYAPYTITKNRKMEKLGQNEWTEMRASKFFRYVFLDFSK